MEEREGMGEEGCGGAAAGREKVEVLQLQAYAQTVRKMYRM